MRTIGRCEPSGRAAPEEDTAGAASDSLPCRTTESDLWFSDLPSELELAKALCHECPARLPCLTGAVERGEPWGVWGGEIFDRGVIVTQKRQPGRPRKHPLGKRVA